MLLHVAVTLAMGFGLVAVAVITAIAAMYLPDVRTDGAFVRTRAARRRAGAEPNEAARAAGSWG